MVGMNHCFGISLLIQCNSICIKLIMIIEIPNNLFISRQRLLFNIVGCFYLRFVVKHTKLINSIECGIVSSGNQVGTYAKTIDGSTLFQQTFYGIFIQLIGSKNFYVV